MCLICIHFDKLTIDESIRNLGEIKESVEKEHYIEVVNKIMTKIVKDYDLDPKYVPTMVSDYISDNDF